MADDYLRLGVHKQKSTPASFQTSDTVLQLVVASANHFRRRRPPSSAWSDRRAQTSFVFLLTFYKIQESVPILLVVTGWMVAMYWFVVCAAQFLDEFDASVAKYFAVFSPEPI